MLPYQDFAHHPVSEQIVDTLCSRTQINEPLFFRVMTGYYLAAAAASMRTHILMPEGNTVPVNVFALNLAPSGFGKGRAISVLEDEVLNQFIQRFTEETFPIYAETQIAKLTQKRAARAGTDPDDELARGMKEFAGLGPYVFSFDSGTAPAVKQLRHKLLMAGSGAINLQIDEVGNNLLKNAEVLDVFLELYDGKVKSKLVKSTSDNQRNEEIRGVTPTNMLLFGAPARILNGGPQEDELMAMLDSGYARRCFFGFIRSGVKKRLLDPTEALALAKNVANSNVLDTLSDHFDALADLINVGKKLVVPEATALLMYQYKLDCETRAQALPEYQEVRKIELESRFFKVMKLAGAYAFVDDSPEVTPAHFQAAIKLAEESGEALEMLLNREKPYVKLARHIAMLETDVTHADLVEELPYYPKSQGQRQDMLGLATAWGYKNNIIIKKRFEDGIEFLRGESLKENDLSALKVAYSRDIAHDYVNETAPWGKLTQLTQAQGLHWINHHLSDGHRQEDSALPGCNLLVIDVDGGVSLETAKLLLKGYRALYYTTKRHTEEENRFRILLPMNYELALDAKDYREFYKNVLEWLPFAADEGCGQRAKKWLSHSGHHEYVEGELFDVLPFIPKTSKNEERKARLLDQASLDNLERWVLNNTGDGNRNQMLLRYALVLLDMGHGFDEIRRKVLNLNDKLPDKLEELEIVSTILVTVGRRLAQSGQ